MILLRGFVNIAGTAPTASALCSSRFLSGYYVHVSFKILHQLFIYGALRKNYFSAFFVRVCVSRAAGRVSWRRKTGWILLWLCHFTCFWCRSSTHSKRHVKFRAIQKCSFLKLDETLRTRGARLRSQFKAGRNLRRKPTTASLHFWRFFLSLHPKKAAEHRCHHLVLTFTPSYTFFTVVLTLYWRENSIPLS